MGLVYVAKPVGVVGAVTPITNPIVTPMCNGMFALKTGNAVIFAPHPKAEKCTVHLANEFMKIVKAHGGPDDLVQTIQNGSVETTQELMKMVDVVVATGGGAMVKSAYSSGKPSFGVGAGNVPVIIDRGVDLKEATEKIVTGASFDNGIICSHEQFVLAPAELYKDVVVLVPGHRQGVVHRGRGHHPEVPRPRVPRRTPEQERGGPVVQGDRRHDRRGRAGDRRASSCCPPRARAPRTSWPRRSCARWWPSCPTRTSRRPWPRPRRTCSWKAPGHSAAVHSNDEGHIRNAGLELPISRLVVNQPSSLTAGGSLSNGFAPDDDARLRLVGRQLDLREPGLQAPDERVAHRQGDHEQEGADRRRDLGLITFP